MRDIAEVIYDGRITDEVAADALNRMDVDTYGLDEIDHKLLRTIIEKFAGGPVGLGTLSASYIARITRASLLEVLEQDYIRTARAKGLPDRLVLIRHTLKNAMVPILTVLGPIFVALVTGSFIVERIFAINGIGRHFVTAIFVRDYGVIMGTTLFYALLVAVANLLIDISYAIVDPRIRYQ